MFVYYFMVENNDQSIKDDYAVYGRAISKNKIPNPKPSSDFNENYKVITNTKATIKGAYTKSKFHDSPLEFGNENYVFNTIFNSERNDECLEGEYKMHNTNIKVSDGKLDKITILDFIKISKSFKRYFALYNAKIIFDEEWNVIKLTEYYSNSDAAWVHDERRKIINECKNDPTEWKEK